MPELKKIWFVHDEPGEDGTHDWLWDELKDDEERLFQLCGGLGSDGDTSPRYLFSVMFGTGNSRWFNQNPKLFSDEASARAEAQKRLDKFKKQYDKRQGKKKEAAADPLVARVVAKVANSR